MSHERNIENLIYLTITAQSTEDHLQAALAVGRFYYQATPENAIIVQAEDHTEKRLDGKTYTSECDWFYAYASKGKESFRTFIGQRKLVTLSRLDQIAMQIERNILQQRGKSVTSDSDSEGITCEELPSLWQQLSKAARRILLQLGTQPHGSLPYRPSEVSIFEELEHYKLVMRTSTLAGGRAWQLSYAGLDLLLALPDTEDSRLKWIRHVHAA